jgi:uncharacterized membrane protein YfcA
VIGILICVGVFGGAWIGSRSTRMPEGTFVASICGLSIVLSILAGTWEAIH